MHFFLQLIWSSLCFTDLNLVFAYSLFLSPFVPPDSIHMIEKTHESPSHNFHFAYQNAKLLLCVDFLMRRKISLFTCRECTLGTFLHAGCCHQYFGKWVFKKKMGLTRGCWPRARKLQLLFKKTKMNKLPQVFSYLSTLLLCVPFWDFVCLVKLRVGAFFIFLIKMSWK